MSSDSAIPSVRIAVEAKSASATRVGEDDQPAALMSEINNNIIAGTAPAAATTSTSATISVANTTASANIFSRINNNNSDAKMGSSAAVVVLEASESKKPSPATAAIVNNTTITTTNNIRTSESDVSSTSSKSSFDSVFTPSSTPSKSKKPDRMVAAFTEQPSPPNKQSPAKQSSPAATANSGTITFTAGGSATKAVRSATQSAALATSSSAAAAHAGTTSSSLSLGGSDSPDVRPASAAILQRTGCTTVLSMASDDAALAAVLFSAAATMADAVVSAVEMAACSRSAVLGLYVEWQLARMRAPGAGASPHPDFTLTIAHSELYLVIGNNFKDKHTAAETRAWLEGSATQQEADALMGFHYACRVALANGDTRAVGASASEQLRLTLADDIKLRQRRAALQQQLTPSTPAQSAQDQQHGVQQLVNRTLNAAQQQPSTSSSSPSSIQHQQQQQPQPAANGAASQSQQQRQQQQRQQAPSGKPRYAPNPCCVSYAFYGGCHRLETGQRCRLLHVDACRDRKCPGHHVCGLAHRSTLLDGAPAPAASNNAPQQQRQQQGATNRQSAGTGAPTGSNNTIAVIGNSRQAAAGSWAAVAGRRRDSPPEDADTRAAHARLLASRETEQRCSIELECAYAVARQRQAFARITTQRVQSVCMECAAAGKTCTFFFASQAAAREHAATHLNDPPLHQRGMLIDRTFATARQRNDAVAAAAAPSGASSAAAARTDTRVTSPAARQSIVAATTAVMPKSDAASIGASSSGRNALRTSPPPAPSATKSPSATHVPVVQPMSLPTPKSQHPGSTTSPTRSNGGASAAPQPEHGHQRQQRSRTSPNAFKTDVVASGSAAAQLPPEVTSAAASASSSAAAAVKQSVASKIIADAAALDKRDAQQQRHHATVNADSSNEQEKPPARVDTTWSARHEQDNPKGRR